MKCKISEYDNNFYVQLYPETIEEVSLLVRISLNSTRELRSVQTYFSKNVVPNAVVVMSKRKNAIGHVGR